MDIWALHNYSPPLYQLSYRRGDEKYKMNLHQGPVFAETKNKIAASSGNRTRAARVAGEHSTTEPTMLSAGYRSDRVEKQT